MQNTGVIVVTNIICAIVFATQVGPDGQWKQAILTRCTANMFFVQLEAS